MVLQRVARLLRYNCDGTVYNGCGGHVSGESGTIDALDDSLCQWYIRVEDGFAIEISVTTFDVDAGSTLKVYEGSSESDSGLIGDYNNANVMGQITSQTRFLHQSYSTRCGIPSWLLIKQNKD